MRIWTVHTQPVRPDRGSRRLRARLPILIPERFSWSALAFGPLWLLAKRLWLEAALLLGAILLVALLLPPALALPVVAAMQVLAGLHGQDLRRGALGRRGLVMAHVVAEHDADRALARLLDARPELVRAPGEAASA